MGTQHDGTPTPAKVKELATEEAKLDRLALIGIFGSVTTPSALIRLPQGKTQKVDVGDTVNGRKVEAIGEDSIVLTGYGTQKVMHLPRG